jgi:hypothetical protein
MKNRPATREEAEKLIGKRTPLPQGRGAGALNDLPLPEEPTPKRMGNFGDPLGLKKNLRDREKAAGLKSGGTVKGCGLATRGAKYKVR